MTPSVLHEASEWIVRQSGSALADAEQKRFCEWYHASTTHAEAYDRLHTIWKHMGDVNDAKLKPRRLSKALACVAVLCAGITTYVLTPPVATWSADYRADHQLRHIPLPDGSTAVLDADSAIALDFTHGRRDIELLAGRVYIVAKPRSDVLGPFTVRTPTAQATALGTRFSVALRDDTTTVTVYEHQVNMRCSTCRVSQSLVLSPGESARTEPTLLRRSSTPEETVPSWAKGLLHFDDTPLPRVAETLSRYSDKAIIVLGDARKSNLSGTVAFDNTQKALDFLLTQTPWRVHSLPGLIIVR